MATAGCSQLRSNWGRLETDASVTNNVNVSISQKKGLRVNHLTCKWAINNFLQIRRQNHLIGQQQFEVDVTSNDGIMSTWCFYLRVRRLETGAGIPEWITIGQKLNKVSTISHLPSVMAQLSKLYVQTTISIQDQSEKYYYRFQGVVKHLSAGGKFYMPLQRKVMRQDKVPLIDDALVITIALKISAAPPPIVFGPEESIGNCKLDGDPWRGRLVTLVVWIEWNKIKQDVALTSKDGKKLLTHRCILSAASPIFTEILRPGLLDDEIGEVLCDDVSGRCLETLLSYFYSGNLLEDWANPDLIKELSYAAIKYELTDLSVFLNAHLGYGLMRTLALNKAEKTSMEGLMSTFTNNNSEECNLVTATLGFIANAIDDMIT